MIYTSIYITLITYSFGGDKNVFNKKEQFDMEEEHPLDDSFDTEPVQNMQENPKSLQQGVVIRPEIPTNGQNLSNLATTFLQGGGNSHPNFQNTNNFASNNLFVPYKQEVKPVASSLHVGEYYPYEEQVKNRNLPKQEVNFANVQKEAQKFTASSLPVQSFAPLYREHGHLSRIISKWYDPYCPKPLMDAKPVYDQGQVFTLINQEGIRKDINTFFNTSISMAHKAKGSKFSTCTIEVEINSNKNVDPVVSTGYIASVKMENVDVGKWFIKHPTQSSDDLSSLYKRFKRKTYTKRNYTKLLNTQPLPKPLQINSLELLNYDLLARLGLGTPYRLFENHIEHKSDKRLAEKSQLDSSYDSEDIVDKELVSLLSKEDKITNINKKLYIATLDVHRSFLPIKFPSNVTTHFAAYRNQKVPKQKIQEIKNEYTNVFENDGVYEHLIIPIILTDLLSIDDALSNQWNYSLNVYQGVDQLFIDHSDVMSKIIRKLRTNTDNVNTQTRIVIYDNLHSNDPSLFDEVLSKFIGIDDDLLSSKDKNKIDGPFVLNIFGKIQEHILTEYTMKLCSFLIDSHHIYHSSLNKYMCRQSKSQNHSISFTNVYKILYEYWQEIIKAIQLSCDEIQYTVVSPSPTLFSPREIQDILVPHCEVLVMRIKLFFSIIGSVLGNDQFEFKEQGIYDYLMQMKRTNYYSRLWPKDLEE